GPCPQCNAPSPLAGNSSGQNQIAPAASWGGPITPASDHAWGNQTPQGSFQGGMNDNALWGQVMAPQPAPGQAQQQYPSILPAQYQSGMNVPQQALKVTSSSLPVVRTGNEHASMVPALPEGEAPIYVPAMYTKPRAIIPPYRAISGLISVIIVSLLLCTGAGFYAKATGKLAFLHILYGDARPANINTAQSSTLPTPQAMPIFGPASQIINSAATASQIDQATAQPRVPSNQFSVGDTIFLTYSVHPKTPGIVTARWFTNNNFYQVSTSTSIKDASSGYFPMQYLQSAEGKVELYWNGQLAVTLFFVVEPAQP
ncbi:MAG TPA: hypothetical protein VE843_09930, partial [Ktedonobacteraceae bacterium]|nr:hypothetical protein [Ktedonobacteraceae bacterium]